MTVIGGGGGGGRGKAEASKYRAIKSVPIPKNKASFTYQPVTCHSVSERLRVLDDGSYFLEAFGWLLLIPESRQLDKSAAQIRLGATWQMERATVADG